MASLDLARALRRIESQFTNPEVCSHREVLIFWPSGGVEGNADLGCDCGKPRLVALVQFSDGSDVGSRQRCFESTVDVIVESHQENPTSGITLEQRCAWLVKDSGFAQEKLLAAVLSRLGITRQTTKGLDEAN
jgi:hypothetical protein